MIDLYEELNENGKLDKLKRRQLGIDNITSEGSNWIEVKLVGKDYTQPMDLLSAKLEHAGIADALLALNELCENNDLKAKYYPQELSVRIATR